MSKTGNTTGTGTQTEGMKREELPQLYRDAVPFPLLRPSQTKAVRAGLLEGKNLLIATPTASGKTLIAILAALRTKSLGKQTIYLAPLKALAAEKARDLEKFPLRSVLTVGDYDDEDQSLQDYDCIITTPEKLDSLLRHTSPWLSRVGCIVVDEIHMLGDNSRGPTLEILITILREQLPSAQIVALSATVHNSAEIAAWLGAELVQDNWRPVALHEGVYADGAIITKPRKG